MRVEGFDAVVRLFPYMRVLANEKDGKKDGEGKGRGRGVNRLNHLGRLAVWREGDGVGVWYVWYADVGMVVCLVLDFVMGA